MALHRYHISHLALPQRAKHTLSGPPCRSISTSGAKLGSRDSSSPCRELIAPVNNVFARLLSPSRFSQSFFLISIGLVTRIHGLAHSMGRRRVKICSL